jgi:O-antigen ligase
LSLERAQLALLAALAATACVSIFASETLLALSFVLLIVRLVLRRTVFVATIADTPLAAFVVWSALSASFAADPARSHEDAKKLLLFALFYVAVEVLARHASRERLLASLLLGGLALAALSVAQYHWLGFDRLDRRPHGFLGHYMSAAGVTMVAFLLAAVRLALGPRPRARLRDSWLVVLVLMAVAAVVVADTAGRGLLGTRLFVAGLTALAMVVALASSPRLRAATAVLPAAVLPLAAWALVVSQTRSAWFGVCCGLATVALVRAPRLLGVLAVVVVALLLLRPGPLGERLTVTDASSVDRYYMWQAGLDMLADRPVFGVGPGMVLAVYPRYRWPEAPNPNAPHLHNNLLQIAVERGVPGLVFFLWWAGAVLLAAVRETRRRHDDPASRCAAVATLAVLAAILAAGFFEYNLGDSEVLLLVLLMTAIPFALARERATSA